MRYIDRILQPGETVAYRGRIHWVIYLPSMIMMLLAVASLIGLAAAQTKTTGYSWLFVSGAFAWAPA